MKKHTKNAPQIALEDADPALGLSNAEAARRAEAGLANQTPDALCKSNARIISDNLFTPFNLLFCVLAGCLAAVGAYVEMLFITVIALNTLIGIVQEIRVKHALEKVSVLEEAPVSTLRDGAEVLLPARELVQGDICLLYTSRCV